MASVDLTAGYPTPSTDDFTGSVRRGPDEVTKLLTELASISPHLTPIQTASSEAKHENKLAIVRLGMATSLYSALRSKHSPTASHSLRVALICATWSERLQLSHEQRDQLEVAAMLHDIGKIGIPDQILRKPGKLSLEEQLTVSLCPQLGCEILRGCCGDEAILDIILHATAWYGGRRDQVISGDSLPMGSRMLAIADAFDAMTTDHVYRPAMSREAAIAQLHRGSGTQFDPHLVNDYCSMMHNAPENAHRQALSRWLQLAASNAADSRWSSQPNPSTSNLSVKPDHTSRFHHQLLSNMIDGVVYVDRDGIIQGWNHAIEKLTGIGAGAVLMNSWTPSLLGLTDEHGDVHETYCPIRRALANSSHVSGRYSIRRIDGVQIPVRLHVAPVTADEPGLCGVVLIAHDSSQQRNLEQRVESLHKQATEDPLTKVANRAAFDRQLSELVMRSIETNAAFSLIICDIDHFKRVNDVHGHQAGDAALVTFASLLSAHSRDVDLVSRYGGEEFVILAPDCDITTAAKRAELIRSAVEMTTIPAIGDQSITASFGVTEYQAGDSPDSVLARADRALLQGKDQGRNRVIQLGMGSVAEKDIVPKRRRGILSWFESDSNHPSQNLEIVTPVPVAFAIEKLRGFIADHNAQIVSVTEGSLQLKLNVYCGTTGRRSVDTMIAFNVSLTLTEFVHESGTESRHVTSKQTKVKIDLAPTRNRDRRRQEANTCASQIIMSLKAYLMGRVVSE